MAAASITNTFTGATPAQASQVNRNFTDLVDFANNDTVHRDGTKPFTGQVSMGSFKIANVASGTNANDAVNVAQLGNFLHAGFIGMHGGATAPPSWLLCDGTAYSRTSYVDLFAEIGTSYGAGDGATTFNVPNMNAKFPYGGTPGSTGGSNDAVAIAHSHTMGTHTHTMPSHLHVTDINHNHASFTTASGGTHSHDAILGNYGADANSGTRASGTDARNTLTTQGYLDGYPRGVTSAGSPHTHPIDVPALGTDNTNSTNVDPGDTNPVDPGDTNPTGVSGTDLNRPAFVGVTFIIKSGL